MHIQLTTSVKIVVDERCKPKQNYRATQPARYLGYMNSVASNCYLRVLTT